MENPRDFKHFFINAVTDEMGTQQYECNPDNSTLYLHDPDVYSEYDHIFRTLSEDELPEEYRDSARNMGAFITRNILREQFDPIAQAMCSSFNFKVVYCPEPTEVDRANIDDQMQATLARELENLNWDDFIE